MKIGVTDLCVLLAYLAGVVLFGLWVGRRQRSSDDYMVGGRDLPWGALLLSIVATETSTVTFLSIPGVAYAGDLRWLQLPLGFILGRFLVVWLFMPGYFAGRFFTAYELLRHRFGGATQKVASLLFMVTRTLADGLRLYLSAIILSVMTGLSMEWAVLGLGVATIVYTFFGGMRAVVWTDVVQFVVYITGAALAFALLLGELPGGWSELWATAVENDKLRVFDFRFTLTDPYVFWAGIVGGAFLTFGTHGVDQIIVQRYLCARSQRDASRALWVSGFVVLLQFAFFMMLGVGLYVFYHLQPELPDLANDRILAAFIVDFLPAGVLGIVLGAVFAAAMSTLSSSLNSSATAAVNDFYLPLSKRRPDEKVTLRAARAFTIVFGALQIGVGIGGQWLDESVVNSVLAIASFTTGLILGLFLLARFARSVRQESALCGLTVGLVVVTTLNFGTELAWPWFALTGSLTTYGAGLLAHRIWPAVSSDSGI